MRETVQTGIASRRCDPHSFQGWTDEDDEAAESAPADSTGGVLASLMRGDVRVLDFQLEGTRYQATLSRSSAPGGTRLSARERRVLGDMVSGQIRKEIAAGLGVGPSTVSTNVSTALERLGLRRWEHLVLLSVLLDSPESRLLLGPGTPAPGAQIRLHSCLDPALLAHLSPAEEQIALLVVQGNTNARIARLRGASVRTVGNQVASIFQKLGAHGRSMLVRTLASGQPVSAGTLMHSAEAGGEALAV